MQLAPRHQCLIYEGPPSHHLASLAAAMAAKLKASCRCIYLNSPAMVTGIRSYLAATGMDVAAEVRRGALVLSSDQNHLVQGRFLPAHMLWMLEVSVEQAQRDGFQGLWATGDMTWEFGPDKNFSKLLDYEYGLEEVFHRQPALSGVCQYHTDTLPPHVLSEALQVHPMLFINDTLSHLNPLYQRHRPPMPAGHVDKSY